MKMLVARGGIEPLTAVHIIASTKGPMVINKIPAHLDKNWASVGTSLHHSTSATNSDESTNQE
jgi:hypothetical protein